MKKKLLVGALLVHALFRTEFIHAQCALDKSQWHVVFSEEFDQSNSATLMSQGHWYYGENPNSITSTSACTGLKLCATPEQLTVNGGYAYFGTKVRPFPIACNNELANYEAAKISTTFDEFPYSQYTPPGTVYGSGYVWGMFEIRCKLPQSDQLFPAFWLCTTNSGTPEIDVFEFDGANHNMFSSTLHWPNQVDPAHNNYCQNFFHYPIDLTSDFHTWTMVWTPKQITWFFDGREIKTDNVQSHQPWQQLIDENNPRQFFEYAKMRVILNNAFNCNTNQNNNNDPLIVDYVKIYKPNGYVPVTSTTNAQTYYDQQVALYDSTPYKSSIDWTINLVSSPNQSYSVDGTLRGAQGGGLFYYRGTDGYLWNTYWTGSQFASARTVPNVPNLTGDIQLAQNGDIVFFRVSNSLPTTGIFYRQSGVNNYITGSDDIDGFGSKFACTSDGLGVYYFNNAGKIVYFSRTSLNAPWTKLVFSSITSARSGSSLLIDPSNPARVYYISTANNIIQMNILGFGPTFNYGVTSTSDVASNLAISQDGKTLYYKDNLGQLRMVSRTTAPTIPPTFTNSVLQVNNAPFTMIKDGLSVSADNTQLYFQGVDNRPWYIYRNGTQYYANTFDGNRPEVSDNFQMVKLGLGSSDEVNLFYRDIYKQIRLIRWQPCEIILPCGSAVLLSGRIDRKGQGLDELAPTETVSIAPNPFSGQLDIRSEPFDEVKIMDMSGRLIYQLKLPAPKSLLHVPTTSFSLGIYVVVISRKGQIIYRTKVTKQ